MTKYSQLPSTSCKISNKKLMSQSQEKRCSKGQMEKLGHFELLSGERKFSPKNSTPTVLSTYGSSTSCTMSEKTND